MLCDLRKNIFTQIIPCTLRVRSLVDLLSFLYCYLLFCLISYIIGLYRRSEIKENNSF